jgi:hypothetical protein
MAKSYPSCYPYLKFTSTADRLLGIYLKLKCKFGALGRIRTPDPLIRSQVLYPTELPAREAGFSDPNGSVQGRIKPEHPPAGRYETLSRFGQFRLAPVGHHGL